MSSASSSIQNKSGSLGEIRVQDVLLEIEQSTLDARAWFETEYGMGEVLFHHGHMVKARLGGARGQTALLRLLAIGEGRYGIEGCSIVEAPAVVQNVAFLIELHRVRQAEWRELCASAPPLSSVLRLTSSGADVRDSSRGIQRVILVLIDGRRTLMQVLEESSFDPVEALKIVTKAVDDDLAQIAPQATSLFPLAPAGDASGVLPRLTASTPALRIDPTSPAADACPPSWRHATLVGIGIKQALSKQSSGGLAPAPIIDIGRRSLGQSELDSGRGHGANSLVKTVIQGFGLGRRSSSARAVMALTEQSNIAKSEGGRAAPTTKVAGRTAGTREVPLQRIVDIAVDNAPRLDGYLAGDAGSLSGEYPADGSGSKADGQRRYIDRYEILLRIGRGGMGTVYLVRLNSGNVGFSRLYAVKLLRSHLSTDTQAAKDFLEEARIAGNLHHANVVSVHDAGFRGKQPYLVMEYIEGCSFDQLTRGIANRSPYFILPIVTDALAGLQAAHTLQDEMGVDLNLVHCDVSPENMLVGVDGICRLTDFGMARKANRLPGATTKGKAGYVAPEQIAGNTFDHRADIFSMGVVLWGALTGKRLFAGETVAETLAQVRDKPIVPPSALGAQSSRALDEIVMHALARNPNDRFGSAEEMLTALGRTAADHGGLATSKDVAAWVREAAGTELAQRRLAILDASRNNPTIPPPPVDAPPAVDLTGGIVEVMAREYESRDAKFRSSSAPPHTAAKQATGAPSNDQPWMHGAESVASSSDAPPRSESDVSSLFYGKDDYAQRTSQWSSPVDVPVVTKMNERRRLLKYRFQVTKPWLLVALLALAVSIVIIVLMNMRQH